MIKIVCLDLAVQNGIYYINDIPKVNGKFIASNYKEIDGGSTVITVVVMTKLSDKNCIGLEK